MSRTTTLTAESVDAIDAVTRNLTVLNNRYYETIDHSDTACFYYPEVDGSSTVVFPGQCDENINVVTNFDAVGVSILKFEMFINSHWSWINWCELAFLTFLLL